MKTNISFGLSVVMGLVYLIFYRSLSPIEDLILFVIVALFIGYSYINANSNHYIKISLLIMIIFIVLIPKVIFSTDSNIIYKVGWTVITILLLQKEIRKEFNAH
ncbi:hypothetical protein CAT7_03514 [Carnobacterium sp. AT7]|uniref:hypothetical protein n=1 Tax=Carnobacterium sp. AT7 TaxID=333990 RepID=UPI00015F17CD|nr:hypothetical protein [Carnobacterium sp. AT7]EDP67181.1 hypothetical protein CAT7_03514 [Carnobacterium sp. AT7]